MEREEKNYKCSYSPTPAAQFSGLRRAGEVEFVIIARERGAITKGHSSPECYTEGKRSGHEATIMLFFFFFFNAPRYAPFFFFLSPFIPIYFIIKLQMR